MDNIVRAKVGKREKILEYSYAGFIFVAILGNSLLEDAGFQSFWIRMSLIVTFLIGVIVILVFLAVGGERQRAAVDRKNGVFTCAVRLLSSTSEPSRDVWDEGAVQLSADGMAFQPQQGPFRAKPAGKKRYFGKFTILGVAEMTGKKTRAWGRSWSIRELQTESGRLHLAASPKSLTVIEERLSDKSA